MSESAPQTTVNVETANVQEPIEVVGGNSPVSWDELSAVDNWRKGLSDEPEVKTAQRRSEEGDDLDQVLEDKQSKKGEKHAKEKSSEEKASKEKSEVLTKSKDKQGKETKESLKALKIKQGESSLDVSPDALVTVKVDGKPVEVPVQEVINRYSQQKHLDDLYRKHKSERQEFETNRKQVADTLKQAFEVLVEKQDLREFTTSLAESLGVDGEKIFGAAVDKIRQELEEESTLTPEERRLRQLERENEQWKSKAEAQKMKQVQAQELKQLDSQLKETLQDYDIKMEDFIEAYDDYVTLPGVDASTVKPQEVAQYHVNLKTYDTVIGAMKEIDEGLLEDAETIEELTTASILLGANEATIKAAVLEKYGSRAAKSLSKKVGKTYKPKVEQAVRNPSSDPLTFDDL